MVGKKCIFTGRDAVRGKRAMLVLFALLWSTNSPVLGEEGDLFSHARNQMVDLQIARRAIRDERVMTAMRTVPRHEFVPEKIRSLSYADSPLPIGEGQTISQPYIVALMTELLALKGGERILEVGTGSGYQAAILAEIAKEVYSIEIIDALARRADETLKRLGYMNIHVKTGDGYGGWPEYAPFDGIIVTAAPEYIPQPLLDQLAVGGRMVIPVGRHYQELLLVQKGPEGITTEKIIPVRFVPMVGEVQGDTNATPESRRE